MGRGGGLILLKRPENRVPREELLMRDVSKMFWELRELRKEVIELRKDNKFLRKQNKKLNYENDLLLLSGLRE